MEKVQVTLLGVQPYKFNDKETGREVAGCNAYFLEQSEQNDEFGKGFIPKKASLPYEAFGVMKHYEFPTVADAILSTSFTAKGVRTKITDFKPIKKANIPAM